MTNKETIYRQDVLDLAKKGVLISNGNYESVCKAINEIPPVNPQEPTDTWSIKDVADTLEKHGLIGEQEPCEDAISRQAVRHILNHEVKMPIKVWKKVFELVDDLPPVTPQPKTGHWIWCIGSHKCSNCEEYTCFSHKELLRYCPNCGAKMVESQERSDKE